MDNRFPLTAIILTQNEAANIEACLACLDWVDDLVLVDSGSIDDTVPLARKARPDLRVFEHPFQDFGDQRNWALDHTQSQHDWILFVDADERITPACANAIRSHIQQANEIVGYFLCCRNLFMGKWIRHSTLYPSWQLRVLKKGHVRFQKEGHGQREVTSGPLAYIPEPYDHYPFSKGLEEWIARHNKYSTNEVELILRLRSEPLRIGEIFSRDAIIRRRALKKVAAHLPARPLLRFLYIYLWRGGFLDGKAGWHYALLRVAHEIHIVTKLAAAKPSSFQPGSR